MRNTLKDQIDRIKRSGATYVDARWYPLEQHQTLVMWNGNLKSNTFSRESGIGVRVLYNGAWGFAASSQRSNINTLFERALNNAKTAAERVVFPVRLADKEITNASFRSPCRINPFDVPIRDKLSLLHNLDASLNQTGVDQRISALRFMNKQIIFVDSDGSEVEKTITETFCHLEVLGRDSTGESHERKFRLGNHGVGTRGWESIRKAALIREAERIVAEMNRVLVAGECPKENRSVILLPGIMFLQTHETIGHALELDRILGYELAYAGGSFVRLADFGTLQYGSEKLTCRADATLPNAPGSFGYDDDGVACQNNLLIDRGILKSAITGRQMVEEANKNAGRRIFTGSGGANRATAFYRVPIERMTNINIDPGSDGTLDDIVSNTEKGIILDGDRSWSIGANREQFHFANEIGWLVDDGRISGVVKNATYKDDTLHFWNHLSAVGDESTWEVVFVENCGKGQPNQIMQLAHGIPTCRFDDVRIGD
jgi:TldD protein